MMAIGRMCRQFVRTNSYRHFSNLGNLSSLKSIHNVKTTFAFNKVNYFCTEAPKQTEDGVTKMEYIIQEIAGDNKELVHKIKVMQLEMEVMRQEGRLIPSDKFMDLDRWREMVKMTSRSSRRKFLQFLFKLEMKKENKKDKKKQEQLEREPYKPPESDHLIYNLKHNNIFLRFYDTTLNHFYNSRLIKAMQFGQKLVVDCGFDTNMVTRENINCAKQLMLLFAENRMHDDPYDLHFCNANPDSKLMTSLYKLINTMYDPSFPLHLHETSYLKEFPKEQLVYLTPHCREVMEVYDHDAIYIIGAIVDKLNNEPLTLAKAKKEGIKMQKLPLDRYLQWGSGSGKSLTLNQMVSILLDMKRTNDWTYALRHVPKRKLVYESEEETNQLKGRPWKPRSTAREYNTKKDFNPKYKSKTQNIRTIFQE